MFAVQGLRIHGGFSFFLDNNLTDTFVLRAYSYNFGFYLWSFHLPNLLFPLLNTIGMRTCDFSTIVEAIEDLGLHYLDSCVYFKIQVGTDVWADSLPVLIDSTGTKTDSLFGTRITTSGRCLVRLIGLTCFRSV